MKLERVSSSNKIRAIFILWLALTGIYLAYILIQGQSSTFVLSVLKSELLMLKPEFLIAEIRNPEGNHLVAAATIKGINLFVFVAAGFIAGILFFRKRPEVGARMPEQLNPEGLMRPEASTSRLMVIPQQGSDDKPVIPSIDPFNESYFRLKRADFDAIPRNETQSFELAIFSILKSYPSVPASPDGFHGESTLLSHSISVARKAKEIAKDKEFTDVLLVSLALAHDIEKLLAYTKNGEFWDRKATHFQQMGASLVRSIPEYSKLTPADRICVVRVLRYYHHPEKMPLDATDRQKTIIDIIRKADQSVTRLERQLIKKTSNQIVEINHDLQESIIEALGRLNINQSIEPGPADGWSMAALPFVAIPEENLRKKLNVLASEKVRKNLQLGVPFKSEGHHPATTRIVNAAKELGLLQLQYKDKNKVVDSPGGLFIIRNGSIQFKGVMLVDKKKLDEVHSGLYEKWGSSKYRIIVQKPYEASTHNKFETKNEP